MHLEAVIEGVWRYTWRPGSSEFGDALGGRDWASLEMHLEAVIERVCRGTWRLWSSEFGDTLGGRNRASMNEYWEAVDGWRAGCWDSIHQLVNSQLWECDKATLLMESWLKAVERVGRHTGSCSYIQGSTLNHENEGKTKNLGWMLYSVYAVLSVNSWSWHGEIERDDLTLCSAMIVELWTRKREMGDEDEHDVIMSGYEKCGVWLAWLGWEDLVSV